MTDMRNIINLVESISNDSINEANFISRVANKGMAALGNKKSQGKVSRDELSKKLSDNFYRWLGRTNKKGTLADLQQFFQQINFTNEQINAITHSVITTIEQHPEQQSSNQGSSEQETQTPMSSNDNTQQSSNQTSNTNESILFELNANDFELTKNEIQQIMDTAASYSFEHGLYGKPTNQQSNNQQSPQQNNNQQSSQQSNNQPTTPNRNGSITRANLFTNSVLNYLNDLGLKDSQIRDMAGAPTDLKFDQLDQTEKDMMAKIGYTLMKYNKTGLQQ